MKEFMDTGKGTREGNEKDVSSEEIDEMTQPSFEKTKKQYEKKKKAPWELLLIIVAILIVVLHFIEE
ncbi:MAG: putative membrane protein YvbJ [Acidimicrobiales bacterium]|jgi:uncharacterized membrane protein YvbJ